MKVDIKVDVKSALGQLGDVRNRQVPFATSLALNRTAQKVKAKQEHEIKDVFDRPTPYIQNSIFIKNSTKRNLIAKVGIKDQSFGKGVPAVKPLLAEIGGGDRRLKKFEKALRSVGAIPNGYFLIPGKKAPIDQYGNVPGSFIVKMISYFKAFPEAGFKANSTKESRRKIKKGTKKVAGASYYVGYAGNGSQLGIWRRSHTGARFTGPVKPIEPMFILSEKARYEPRYDLKFVAESTVQKEFNGEFIKAWEEATRTAR